MTTVLEVKDLTVEFSFNGRPVAAVESVKFNVAASETLAIVGESGSGKSVTALALMGLLREPAKIRQGEVILQGINLLNSSSSVRRELRGNRISMIFQEPMSCLNPSMTIGKQIEEALVVHGKAKTGESRQRVLQLIRQVGLTDPEKVYTAWPHQLSGGMNQRVMIAMAIACRPGLLIADEPTTALDVTVQAQIINLLKRLQEESTMAMIFISHDLSVVAEIADRVVVMYAGQVVENAPVDQLLKNPAHPYTSALLMSQVANFNEQKRRFITIEGTPPVIGEMPRGCRFHPRCQYAREDCRQQTPDLFARHRGVGSVRCFYPLNEAGKKF
jgi:oligopeptide/dipeptide ABC transporter ATP-binding protein